MKLYVYCVAEDVETLDQPILGISGAAVRVLKLKDLSLLVTDLETDAVPVTGDNALAHAAVVRSILDRTTPLPFRFGTVVGEEQLGNYVSAREAALKAKLAELRGCIEMSVKIISDQIQPEPRPQDPAQGPGATFLAAKRHEILGDESNAARAAEVSQWLHDQLSSLISNELVTLRPTDKMILSAAHLVERGKVGLYREKLAEMRQNRRDLHFLLSGPWPPYSFANIELELKTQFGVS